MFKSIKYGNCAVKQRMSFAQSSVLSKQQTGLPVFVWVDDIGIEHKSGVNIPKIAFQNDYADKILDDIIFVSISLNPEILYSKQDIKINNADINKVKSFIICNYDFLMSYWKQLINLEQLFKLIRKV